MPARSRLALTGGGSPLGVRTRAALTVPRADGAAAEVVDVDLASPSLDLEGFDALVHLGREVPSSADGEGSAAVDGAGTVPDPAATRRLLDAAGEAGIDRVVVLSSAMVYGAWPTNSIPLTEDAVIKPNPSLRFAVERAEEERLVAEWRAEHSEVAVSILRPTVQVAEDRSSWLASTLWAGEVQTGDAEPPVQFVHLDDVASAIATVVEAGSSGAFNVAPDGWLSAEQLMALVGPTPQLRVPDAVATRIAAVRYRFGWVSSPPGVVAYLAQPWVVANDRLRNEGWKPAWTNEEAFVAADRPGFLATLTPKRRQELALGIAGTAIAATVVGVGLGIRRAVKKRR